MKLKLPNKDLPVRMRGCGRFLLTLFMVISLSFLRGYGMPAMDPIQLHLEQVPLKKVLKEIEKQTDYTFVFNADLIDVNEKVSVHLDSENLYSALSEIFSGLNIIFQFKEKHIILTKDKEIKDPAQDKITINGSITDQSGEPLIGVNIFIKGTTEGTITDLEGKFTIRVSPGEILVFSYIGYINQEVSVTEATTLNIVLEEEAKELEEVVVIGYGSESKALLTSSISSVSAAEITEAPVASISSALQGRATGLRVVQNSGAPGAGITVRVRGVSSINAGAEPLYVIDGVPMLTENFGQIGFSGQGVNSISDINPADIESISILKDASASAIYGARASNGVVLITTKRGKSKESIINFNANYGWQQVINKLDMLNAREFMIYKNEASVNDGGVPIYSDDEINNVTTDTDWLDELFRTAPMQNYDLSVTGGSDKTRYYISGSYFDQQGIVMGTDYSKLSARTNIDHSVNDRIEVGASIAISRSVNNRKEGDQSLNGPVPNAISLPPIFPVYNEDGTFNDDGPLANPISIATYHENKAYSFRNLGNIYAQYEIFKNFTFEAKYGLDYINYREHTYDPSITRQGSKYKGLGLESSSEAINSMISATVNYNFSLNDHKFDLLAGTSYENYSRSEMYIRGQDFPSPELEYIVSAANIVDASTYGVESKLNSYLGRLKYNFNNKYLITVSSRYDGSSRFGKNNKYGFFPSADGAWRITEEDFFPENNILTDLKIRVGHGMTGNDKIPNFAYMALYSSGNNYNGLPGVAPSQLPNPDLKWETTSQSNLGIDFQFFNNRIDLQADLYLKKTKDLLLARPLPLSSGFGSITSNVGSMENRGLEIALRTQNLVGEFKWETNINANFNQNKVTELYNDQPIDNIGRGGNRVEVGEPIGIFYGWNSLGVDPTTGDLVFEDVNEDGSIDASDRTKIGNPHPIVAGGFFNSFSYKSLTLDIFFQYSYGNDIFNGTRRYIEVMKGIDNQTAETLRRWKQIGDETDMPRATNADPNENDRQSSRFIEDGSYLKLKNIRLSYRFNPSLTRRLGIDNLTVFALGQNLITFTNYSGMDPEVNYAGQDVLRMGTDFFTYPQAKSLSFGLSMSF